MIKSELDKLNTFTTREYLCKNYTLRWSGWNNPDYYLVGQWTAFPKIPSDKHYYSTTDQIHDQLKCDVQLVERMTKIRQDALSALIKHMAEDGVYISLK